MRIPIGLDGSARDSCNAENDGLSHMLRLYKEMWLAVVVALKGWENVKKADPYRS
jgi:hypothetical protein